MKSIYILQMVYSGIFKLIYPIFQVYYDKREERLEDAYNRDVIAFYEEGKGYYK